MMTTVKVSIYSNLRARHDTKKYRNIEWFFHFLFSLITQWRRFLKGTHTGFRAVLFLLTKCAGRALIAYAVLNLKPFANEKSPLPQMKKCFQVMIGLPVSKPTSHVLFFIPLNLSETWAVLPFPPRNSPLPLFGHFCDGALLPPQRDVSSEI